MRNTWEAAPGRRERTVALRALDPAWVLAALGIAGIWLFHVPGFLPGSEGGRRFIGFVGRAVDHRVSFAWLSLCVVVLFVASIGICRRMNRAPGWAWLGAFASGMFVVDRLHIAGGLGEYFNGRLPPLALVPVVLVLVLGAVSLAREADNRTGGASRRVLAWQVRSARLVWFGTALSVLYVGDSVSSIEFDRVQNGCDVACWWMIDGVDHFTFFVFAVLVWGLAFAAHVRSRALGEW